MCNFFFVKMNCVLRCLDAGLDKTHDLDLETGETPTEGGSGGARKKKRRRNKWASGVARSGRKKVAKKKIFESDEEKKEKEEKEEEEEEDGKDEENNEPMEEEEEEGVEEKGEKEKGSKIDLDSSSINLVKKLVRLYLETISKISGEVGGGLKIGFKPFRNSYFFANIFFKTFLLLIRQPVKMSCFYPCISRYR